jgi:hypothetical protein
MPRKNENGFHSTHERRLREWGYRDPASWNPLLSKYFTPNSELRTPNHLNLTPHSEIRDPNYSTIKTTGEDIVREFRRETLILRQVHIQAPKKSFIRKFIDCINWRTVLDLVCIGALVIAIAVIFSLIVFGPFSMRELWK